MKLYGSLRGRGTANDVNGEIMKVMATRGNGGGREEGDFASFESISKTGHRYIRNSFVRIKFSSILDYANSDLNSNFYRVNEKLLHTRIGGFLLHDSLSSDKFNLMFLIYLLLGSSDCTIFRSDERDCQI